MKPGDRVRVREELPVEWPKAGTSRRVVEVLSGRTATLLAVDAGGLLVIMTDGTAEQWADWCPDRDGWPELPCHVVPAAALEPVPPPLPDGWTVDRLGRRVTVYGPDQLRAATIDGGGIYLWSTAHHPPADLLAALAHLVAVAEVTP